MGTLATTDYCFPGKMQPASPQEIAVKADEPEGGCGQAMTYLIESTLDSADSLGARFEAGRRPVRRRNGNLRNAGRPYATYRCSPDFAGLAIAAVRSVERPKLSE
jgi:hypothetical protein